MKRLYFSIKTCKCFLFAGARVRCFFVILMQVTSACRFDEPVGRAEPENVGEIIAG